MLLSLLKLVSCRSRDLRLSAYAHYQNILAQEEKKDKQVSYESEIQTSRRMPVTKLYPLPRYIAISKKKKFKKNQGWAKLK